MYKTIFALLCIFLLAISFQQPTAGNKKNYKASGIVDEAVRSRIDATLKSLVDSGDIAGASALIFEKNKEVYFNAFGCADKEAKISMGRNTIVRIYSMTKPVTGVALMQLYEKGAFNWTTRFQNTLPNLRI